MFLDLFGHDLLVIQPPPLASRLLDLGGVSPMLHVRMTASASTATFGRTTWMSYGSFSSTPIDTEFIEKFAAAGAGIEPADSWFKAMDFCQQKLPRTKRDGRDSNPRDGA